VFKIVAMIFYSFSIYKFSIAQQQYYIA